MTSIATVKPKLDSARVAAGASTKLSFAVTNTTGRALRMGAKMLADAPADAAWAKLTGNNEREFGVDDFDQFDVDVTIPADAAPGQYKFRLLVFQTDEPGELFTEGPTVSIQVPKPDEPVNDKPDGGGFPWWIAVVVGVLALLVVGGVVAWYLLKPSDVPDVTGMQLDDAIIALQEADLDIPQTGGVIEEWTGEAEPGFVTKQMPEAGGDKPDDGLVTLTIEQLTVAVPSVIGMKVPAATTLLSEAGLGLSGTIDFQRSDRFPGGAIIAQQPTATERAIPGQEVAVTVAEELIPVPDLNGKSFSQASVALEALGLAVGKISHEKTGGSPDTVVRQEPSANTEAKAASAVDLWLVEKKIAVPNVK
ncbi:MAG: PASTA domain-containing protein, partial [Thiohalocapsa sp.]